MFENNLDHDGTGINKIVDFALEEVDTLRVAANCLTLLRVEDKG